MPKILPVLGSFNVHTFPDLRFTSAGAAGVRHEEHRIANSWGRQSSEKSSTKTQVVSDLFSLLGFAEYNIFEDLLQDLSIGVMNINREHLAFFNAVHVKVVEQKLPVNESVCSQILQPWNSTTYCFHCFVLRKDHCCGKDLPATNPGDSSIERHESFETELYGKTANLDPENPARGKEPVSQRKNLPTCIIPVLFTYSRR